MRPRTLQRFWLLILLAWLAAAAIFAAGIAKATPADEIATDVCEALDNNPTVGEVSRLITIFISHGATPYEAGEFIGSAVATHCTRDIPILQAFINTYSANGGQVA